MSSQVVRSTIMNYLAFNWIITPVYNLSDYIDKETLEIGDLPTWVGVQFLDSTEEFAGVGTQCYKEAGTIVLHVASATGIPSSITMVICEQLRDLFRGMYIGPVVIEAVDPPTDQKGEAIKFDGDWHGFAIYMDYYRYFDTP